MIESIDSLIVIRDRVVVSDIKLRVFLDHRLVGPLCPRAVDQLEDVDTTDQSESGPTGQGTGSRLVSGLPAAPQNHLLIVGVLFLNSPVIQRPGWLSQTSRFKRGWGEKPLLDLKPDVRSTKMTRLHLF